jgi:hypothetical protein
MRYFVTRFDQVVGENGALLYRPESRAERVLAEPPPETLIQELRRRGVATISVGRVIVATTEPYERIAVEVKQILERVDLAVTVGKKPGQDLSDFARAVGAPTPLVQDGDRANGEAIFWRPRSGKPPMRFQTISPESERRRHVRKYAEGSRKAIRKIVERRYTAPA